MQISEIMTRDPVVAPPDGLLDLNVTKRLRL